MVVLPVGKEVKKKWKRKKKNFLIKRGLSNNNTQIAVLGCATNM